MKILLLVESLAVNRTSSGIVSSNFINAISGENDIFCLHNETDFTTFPWLKNVKVKSIKQSEKTQFEKILSMFPKIRALPTYLLGYSLLFNRLVNDWKKEIIRELAINKYDLVVVLGTGSSFAPHFAMAEMDSNVRWVANIHDPYPMNHYPKPYQKDDTIFYKQQVKRIDRVFKQANWVTFPSKYLLGFMSQYHPQLKNKSFVLPHLESFFANLPEVPEDKKVSLQEGKFNLLHAGSLLGPRDPRYLIKAFMRFIDEDIERKEKSVLNIIGKVSKEHTGFEKEYEAVKDNINILITRVSYKHSLELLKQADILIILEAIAKESPFMPGKLADYITANKPILALTPKYSETSRLLGEFYPYTTQTDNEEEIYMILVNLWEEWKSGNLNNLDRDDLREYISSENINKILMEHINVYHS